MRGVTVVRVPRNRPYPFQPALPMRGVTLDRFGRAVDEGFQPALPMRGVTMHFQKRRDR